MSRDRYILLCTNTMKPANFGSLSNKILLKYFSIRQTALGWLSQAWSFVLLSVLPTFIIGLILELWNDVTTSYIWRKAQRHLSIPKPSNLFFKTFSIYYQNFFCNFFFLHDFLHCESYLMHWRIYVNIWLFNLIKRQMSPWLMLGNLKLL